MMIKINPTKIKVREGLERYRKDLGKVEALAKSIVEHGQLQPIIINEEKELVDGGRRLAACILAGIDALAIYRKDIKTDDQMRTVEIIANMERKAFTPAEEQLAIAELHRIKMKESGENPDQSGGGEKKKWNMEKTAAILGVTKGTISTALKDANAILQNPELKTAKSKGEIRNKAEKIEKIKAAFLNVEKAEKAGVKEEKWTVLHKRADEFLAEQDTNSADIIITDPPYMINIHENRQVNNPVDSYDDNSDELKAFMLNNFPEQCFRVLKPTGSIYMFIGSEWFVPFSEAFTKAGFFPYWKEIIWVKGSTGQTNNPNMWPGDCYEKIFYARKPETRLVKEGMPNWIHCPPIYKSVHQAEKPVALIDNLILRSCLPGEILLDPFCGSGAVLEAGIKRGLTVKGCEIKEEYVALSKERLLKK